MQHFYTWSKACCEVDCWINKWATPVWKLLLSIDLVFLIYPSVSIFCTLPEYAKGSDNNRLTLPIGRCESTIVNSQDVKRMLFVRTHMAILRWDSVKINKFGWAVGLTSTFGFKGNLVMWKQFPRSKSTAKNILKKTSLINNTGDWELTAMINAMKRNREKNRLARCT